MANIDSGWCYTSVRASGKVTVADGSADITFDTAADYNNISNIDVIFIEISSTYGYYPCFTIKSGGGTSSMTMETAFSGTSGAYYFYYSPNPRTLYGPVSYKRTLESPSDTIGLPSQRWTGALAFDVEGVVMKISVDGILNSTLGNIVIYQNQLDENMDGGQMNRKPTWIWYAMEPAYGGFKAYPVHFTKIDYSMEPKQRSGNTTYILKYKIECVACSPTQA